MSWGLHIKEYAEYTYTVFAATEYDEANTTKYQIYFRRRGGNVIFKKLCDWTAVPDSWNYKA